MLSLHPPLTGPSPPHLSPLYAPRGPSGCPPPPHMLPRMCSLFLNHPASPSPPPPHHPSSSPDPELLEAKRASLPLITPADFYLLLPPSKTKYSDNLLEAKGMGDWEKAPESSRGKTKFASKQFLAVIYFSKLLKQEEVVFGGAPGGYKHARG